MTTTISAFMVKAAPMVGIDADERRQQDARDRRQRSAGRERECAVTGHVDADQRGGARAHRDRAHGAADRRVAQERIDAARQRQRRNQDEQAVGTDHSAEQVEGNAQIAVGAVGAGPGDERDTLQHEQQAEGGEDRVDLALALVLGTAEKRMQHVREEQPAQAERQGRPDEKREHRRQAQQREAPEGSVARQHQELAVGEVEDASYAVLQVEPDRDQRIDAPDHQAREQEIEQHHVASTGARLGRGSGFVPFSHSLRKGH